MLKVLPIGPVYLQCQEELWRLQDEEHTERRVAQSLEAIVQENIFLRRIGRIK